MICGCGVAGVGDGGIGLGVADGVIVLVEVGGSEVGVVEGMAVGVGVLVVKLRRLLISS